MWYLKLKQSNCKHCYKCIRHCPVKSIDFFADQANIVQKECILCGECFVNCPQNAKYIREDLGVVKELAAKNERVFVSIAPSFIANYPGATLGTMKEALRKLGFYDVLETAIGATAVKARYDEMIDNAEGSIIISSCCHSINMLIQKYYPDVLKYLAKVASPMLAHGRMIKQADPMAKVVFIGPCISKKQEAELYPGSIDAVLTFDELDEWLSEMNITIGREAEPDIGGKARLFPVPGGILRSMELANSQYKYIAIDGVENCIDALKDIVRGDMPNCFVEMSSCAGGCVGGPVMSKAHLGRLRDYMLIDKGASTCDFEIAQVESKLLDKQMTYLTSECMRPGRSDIEEVLRKTGKTKIEDELNCGSCGYDTCREKAAAVLMGKAEISMCLPYLMARTQSFSDTIIFNTPNGIIVLDENLKVQQINKAACAILGIAHKSAVINCDVVDILDPTSFVEVLNNKRNIYERKLKLLDHGKVISQSVIYDNKYHVVIAIMRDITNEELERTGKEELARSTIEIADKVIAKQMRVVQEIASLLGETTAETNIALSKLKETFANE